MSGFDPKAKKKKKTLEDKGDSDTDCNWRHWNGPHKNGKETGEIGNQRKNCNHPDHGNFRIS